MRKASVFTARKSTRETWIAGQPWFLSDFVDATHDVTVAVVRDELFAFELDRSIFIDQTIDWRQSPVRHHIAVGNE